MSVYGDISDGATGSDADSRGVDGGHDDGVDGGHDDRDDVDGDHEDDNDGDGDGVSWPAGSHAS